MILRAHGGIRRAVFFAVAIALFCAAGTADAYAQSPADRYLGSIAKTALNAPIVGIAATPSGHGYWLAAADGGVFTFGDAHYRGSTGHRTLTAPIVDIAATPSGNGYWLAAADGGVFTFGDAHYRGSTGHRTLTAPIVDIAATPSGNGYWLAAADGGVFTFGDAHYRGSTGHRALTAPIVGIAPTRSGNGYRLAAADGRVFAFGDASAGRSVRSTARSPIVGISTVAYGGRDGYWLVAANGRTLGFGHAGKYTTRFPVGASSIASSVATIAASPAGGYWVASLGGRVGVSTGHAVTAASVTPPAKTARPSASTSLKVKPRVGLQLLERMNAERRARHMRPFAWDPVLAKRATIWARTLLVSGRFEHQNFGAIASAAKGRFSEIGENLFSGTGSAADAGTAHLVLMRSLEHRANILLRQGQLVGIAAVCLRGKLMVVQDFAIKQGAPLPSSQQGIPATNPIVASNEDGAGCAQR